MGKYKDLIGQKFGKLTVIALDEERTEKSLEERRKKIRARSHKGVTKVAPFYIYKGRGNTCPY